MICSSVDVVALDPGAEEAVGHVVLGLAGAHAVAAADALGDVDEHAPPVVGHLVVGRLLRECRPARTSRRRRRPAAGSAFDAGKYSFRTSCVVAGLAAVRYRTPWICAAGGRSRRALRRSGRQEQPAGSPSGLAALAVWQRAQSTVVSGSTGLTVERDRRHGLRQLAPWQASQFTCACLPPFFLSARRSGRPRRSRGRQT